MDQSAIIDYLAEFYDEPGIRAIWKEVGDAALGRVRLPIQINQRSRDGSSSTGILVSTQAEAAAYMNACRLSIARLTGVTTTSADQLGTGIDFSYRPVSV